MNTVCANCLEDIEIICVNDGSTDHSPDILRDFAAKDKRIRIIDQENRGLGAARNSGIAVARGKYLSFVDSDDWVDRFIWFYSVKKAEQNHLDMLLYRPQAVNDETGEDVWIHWHLLRFPEECLRHNFTWRDINMSPFDTCCYAHNKVVLRSFWGDRKFPENCLYEDAANHFDLLLSAKNLGALDFAAYYYRIRPNSLMGRRDDRVLDHLKVLDRVAAVLRDKNLFGELEYAYLYYAIYLLDKTYKMNSSHFVLKKIREWITAPEHSSWHWEWLNGHEKGLFQFFSAKGLFAGRLASFLYSKYLLHKDDLEKKILRLKDNGFLRIILALSPYGIFWILKKNCQGGAPELPGNTVKRIIKLVLPYWFVAFVLRKA